jgi:hypothetical protein
MFGLICYHNFSLSRQFFWSVRVFLTIHFWTFIFVHFKKVKILFKNLNHFFYIINVKNILKEIIDFLQLKDQKNMYSRKIRDEKSRRIIYRLVLI